MTDDSANLMTGGALAASAVATHLGLVGGVDYAGLESALSVLLKTYGAKAVLAHVEALLGPGVSWAAYQTVFNTTKKLARRMAKSKGKKS